MCAAFPPGAGLGLALLAGGLAAHAAGAVEAAAELPAAPPARRLMASANDGKYVLGPDGQYRAADPVEPDTLTVLDVSADPPRALAHVAVEASVIGPPTEVALSPDEALAVVSAPKRLRASGRPELDDVGQLLVVDLTATPPAVAQRLDLPAEPYGIAFNPAGTLLGVAHFDGRVSLVGVRGGRLAPLQTLRVAPEGMRVS